MRNGNIPGYCFFVSLKCYHRYVGTGTGADSVTIPYQLMGIMLMSLWASSFLQGKHCIIIACFETYSSYQYLNHYTPLLTTYVFRLQDLRNRQTTLTHCTIAIIHLTKQSQYLLVTLHRHNIRILPQCTHYVYVAGMFPLRLELAWIRAYILCPRLLRAPRTQDRRNLTFWWQNEWRQISPLQMQKQRLEWELELHRLE